MFLFPVNFSLADSGYFSVPLSLWPGAAWICLTPPLIVLVGNEDYIKYKGEQVIVTCSFVLIVIVYKLEVVVVGGKSITSLFSMSSSSHLVNFSGTHLVLVQV